MTATSCTKLEKNGSVLTVLKNSLKNVHNDQVHDWMS